MRETVYGYTRVFELRDLRVIRYILSMWTVITSYVEMYVIF